MKQKLFIILLFVILTLLMTYPLILKITTYIPGFFSTDEPYSILWDSWRIKFSLLNKLSLQTFPFTAHPFGLKIFFPPTIIWFVIHEALSIITTPILTYNIQVLVNFILCGFFAYLLVLYLTDNMFSAVLSGIAFAFCPYQFVRSWQHLTATYNQWLPLTLLLLFLVKKPTLKREILFFIGILLLFSFDYYLAYFTSVSIILFLIYLIFYNWRLKIKAGQATALKSDLIFLGRILLITGIFFIIYFIPVNYSLIKNMLSDSKALPSAFNPFHRPFDDLFAQSAKPLSYFLPCATHPVFGKFTEQFIGSPLYGESFTEHALYLGWMPLILAFAAVKRWNKRRKGSKDLGTLSFEDNPDRRENFYIGFFIFLAVVAWLFSQPPWWQIGPIKIYLPSFFMYKLLPMFRAYCRFGIVLMLAVAVLAGFGLKFILAKHKSQKIRIGLTCLFSGLILFEFWNWPPYKVIDVSLVPAAYYWLKDKPGNIIVAEYPLDADSPNQIYKFYQTKYEKKIINGSVPQTGGNRIAKSLVNLSERSTTGKLREWQVKYVIVHTDSYLETGLIEDRDELKNIQTNKDLKLIESFPAQECPQKDIMCVQKTGPIDIYEIVREPIKPGVRKK